LFSVDTREIYIGLLDRVIQFCKDHDYTYEFVNNKFYGLPFEINENISKEGVKDYVTSISKYEPRSYQIDGVYDALRHNRKLLISPTASGKSLMIYSLVRYYVEKQQNILVVVPTTSLCYQMYKDFEDYGFDSEKNVSIIMGGKEKNQKIKKIVITFDDGEKRTFNINDKVKTKRGFVLAKDLMEDDLIL
jgi:superfamily II DNA or RNA helicase